MSSPESDRESNVDRGGSGRSVGSRYGSAYQGAVEAVGALLVGALLGSWLDSRFGTAPAGLLGGLAVGFGAFVLRLSRMRPPVGGSGSESADRRPGPGEGS